MFKVIRNDCLQTTIYSEKILTHLFFIGILYYIAIISWFVQIFVS
jgi:hypothetical protein